MKDETVKQPSGTSKQWQECLERESQEWRTVRYVFWPAAVVAAILTYVVLSPSYRSQIFLVQNLVFIGLALIAVVLGYVIGYRNSKNKTLWTLADLLWTLLVLFTLVKILAPVEAHFRTNEITLFTAVRDITWEDTARKVAEAKSMLCARPANDDLCNRLAALHNQLAKAPTSTAIVFPLASSNAPLAAAEKVITDQLDRSINSIRHQQSELAKLETARTVINPLHIYGQVVVTILILGLRVGRTGAEQRRNIKEKQDEENWKKRDKDFR